MNRSDVIKELGEYFDVRELVCPHTYQKFGNKKSWQFLETIFLETLLVLRRDILGVSMTCNNYMSAGKRQESGFRCNICSIPKSHTVKNEIYNSAHCSGNAGDFIFGKMTAEEARQKIKANAHKLPHPIRIEKGVSWLHVDCFDALTGEKINEF